MPSGKHVEILYGEKTKPEVLLKSLTGKALGLYISSGWSFLPVTFSSLFFSLPPLPIHLICDACAQWCRGFTNLIPSRPTVLSFLFVAKPPMVYLPLFFFLSSWLNPLAYFQSFCVVIFQLDWGLVSPLGIKNLLGELTGENSQGIAARLEICWLPLLLSLMEGSRLVDGR